MGLKYKAIGLAQPLVRASSHAQVLGIGSDDTDMDHGPSKVIHEPSSLMTDSVDPDKDRDCYSSDSDEQEEELESSLEVPEAAIVCVDAPSPPLVWVDLAPMDHDLRIDSGFESHFVSLLSFYEMGKHLRLLLVRSGGGAKPMVLC